MSNLNFQKFYYYIICIIAAFILIWGTIDTVSAGANFIFSPSNPSISASPPAEEGVPVPGPGGEQLFDDYYRKRMASDRLTDSLSRLIISGLIFAYARLKIKKLEGED